MKEATITINVKSLTGGYEVPDKENTNTTNTTGSSSSTTVKEKKLTVKVDAFSEGAKSKIEAAGGTCEVI